MNHISKQGTVILLLLVLGILSALLFASCSKETHNVPPAIQRIIDNGGYDDKDLLGIDEYGYNGDIVYLCFYRGHGWFTDVVYSCVTIRDGSIIGWATGYERASIHYIPGNPRGCFADFMENGAFRREIINII